MKFAAIIPARYASSRFPGKPLADLWGKPMVRHVYERVEKILPAAVWVATDDERIAAAVRTFGGRALMTSPLHRSGTDRCGEALEQTGGDFDVVINVQGDEPFIHPEQLRTLMACFTDAAGRDVQIATLVKPIGTGEEATKTLFNPNVPKVALNRNGEAIYFSRAAIPYVRGKEASEWVSSHIYYKHIGIYAYRCDILRQLVQLPAGTLEAAESLEQLRWIENGYTIRAGITNIETIGIDTPDDYARALHDSACKNSYAEIS
ncbi:MAG: 3-deoxy-manno-octulosonate cytidylyltransferase [Tannerellaceae bacterium]|nr:3-deoxy-manno-octulosonate cytidylyltransferase [Tannerellaceae bacterium]